MNRILNRADEYCASQSQTAIARKAAPRVANTMDHIGMPHPSAVMRAASSALWQIRAETYAHLYDKAETAAQHLHEGPAARKHFLASVSNLRNQYNFAFADLYSQVAPRSHVSALEKSLMAMK